MFVWKSCASSSISIGTNRHFHRKAALWNPLFSGPSLPLKQDDDSPKNPSNRDRSNMFKKTINTFGGTCISFLFGRSKIKPLVHMGGSMVSKDHG